MDERAANFEMRYAARSAFQLFLESQQPEEYIETKYLLESPDHILVMFLFMFHATVATDLAS